MKNTITITEPAYDAAGLWHAKRRLNPSVRALDDVELPATGERLLEIPRASGRLRRGGRECEGGRGHGCCKHPI
jgi:hypothetical protein